jgi:alkylated DNA repair dioxygenase AlkB
VLEQQLDLFGRDEPTFDATFQRCRREQLGSGAWIDYAQGWISGHATLMQSLLVSTDWQHVTDHLYDREVVVPRLIASVPEHGPGHALLETVRKALCARYRHAFTRISLALYRDGDDSVAYHGDRVARDMPNALVATVSVGAPRCFRLRPKPGGASRAYQLGNGDLLVMGGSCQRTWQHAIPKLAHAQPRIAIMFRSHYGATNSTPRR